MQSNQDSSTTPGASQNRADVKERRKGLVGFITSKFLGMLPKPEFFDSSAGSGLNEATHQPVQEPTPAVQPEKRQRVTIERRLPVSISQDRELVREVQGAAEHQQEIASPEVPDLLDERRINFENPFAGGSNQDFFIEVKRGENLRQFAEAVIKRVQGADYNPSSTEVAMCVQSIGVLNNIPRDKRFQSLTDDMDLKITLSQIKQ